MSVIIVFISITSTTLTAEDTKAARFQKIADRLVKAINDEDYAAIRQDFGKPMLNDLSLPKTKTYFKNLMTTTGKIKKLGTPRLVPPNQAIFPAYFEKTILDIKIVLDLQDKMIGLFLLPHIKISEAPIIKNHKTKLHLPVEGEWFVLWGGDTRELNQHYDVSFQKFAFDLAIMNSTGKTFTGKGTINEDYFAFGKEILAPGNGVVTDVITGVRDNIPGVMNPYATLGNAVLVKHRNNEISVFAHFKQGSIKVKVGDRVKSGRVLGLCGNSGNSSEPHFHYHMQNDTPMIQDGTGIKCFFEDVVVKRRGREKTLDKYSPIKGDTVRRK